MVEGIMRGRYGKAPLLNRERAFQGCPERKKHRFCISQITMATTFGKTDTPPTNINLSPRHVTSLNQGLSSLAPFGVERQKTSGTRLMITQTLTMTNQNICKTQNQWPSHARHSYKVRAYLFALLVGKKP